MGAQEIAEPERAATSVNRKEETIGLDSPKRSFRLGSNASTPPS